jgi:hypothetical protein
MATEEKVPSIYHDRAAIGSSDELDEYGVWVKIEPQDVSDLSGLSFPESLKLPDFDIDLDFDKAAGSADDGISFPGTEDISFDDSIPADESPDSGTGGLIDSGDTAYDGDNEIGIENFDDLEAVRKDIFEPRTDKTALRSGNDDLSTRLLMKIAEELNSIKGELSGLKSELASVRGEIAPVPPAAAEPENGSFFDEDEDEKIALTGDELDNILHTADFTEEAGTDASEGLTEEDIAVLSDSDFAVPPSETNEPALASNTEFEEPETLKQFQEEGAVPVTGTPDDTSYLENDDPLDLSDAVIDEPDLSGTIVENPLEEPSPDALDISLPEFDEISLDEDGFESSKPEEAVPAAENASADLSADAFEEISFDDIGADAETIDISSFGDDSPAESSFGEVSFEDLHSGAGDDILTDEVVPKEDLTFEMLKADAELPIHENTQDNVITDDSFDIISLDDTDEFLLESPAGQEAEGAAGSGNDTDNFIQLDDTIDLTETPKTEGVLNLMDSMDSIELEEKAAGTDDVTGPEETLDPDLGESLDLDDTIELAGIPLETETDAAYPSAAEPEEASKNEDAASILGQIMNQLDVDLPPAEETPEAPPEKPAGEDAASILGQIMGQLENTPAAEKNAPVQDETRVEKKNTPKSRTPLRRKAKPRTPVKTETTVEAPAGAATDKVISTENIPTAIKAELKTVLTYMDQLLESLPEEKIEEFAQSEYFETYKKLFEDLGIE